MRSGILLLGISLCLAQAPDDLPVLQSARGNALAFTATLPDFECDQVIDRLEGAPGAKAWRKNDRLLVKLRYLNGKEEYRLVSINGRPTDGSYEGLGGATSTGEFGSWLSAIFDPETAAEFAPARREAIQDRPATIFSYRVAREHSHYEVSYREGAMPRTVTVGYRGRVFIDLATAKVMRVEVRADELPANFPLREASLMIEYGFTRIGGREYLLPSYAETRLVMGRLEFRNNIDFRNYRKFEAQASVCFENCVARGDQPVQAAAEKVNLETANETANAEPANAEPVQVEGVAAAARVVPIAVPAQTTARVIDVMHATAEMPLSIRLEPTGAPSAAPQREHQLVRFEVVVLDKHGRPVPGLTAADFHIQDQGRDLPVATCRASGAPPEPQPPALAAEQSSNRAAAAPSRVRVILWDAGDATFARGRLVEALRGDAADEDVYFYLLTSSGLEAIRGLPQAGVLKPEPALEAIDLDWLSLRARKRGGDDPDPVANQSLRSLASSLAVFPGRKSIIWITHGPRSIDAETMGVLQRARAAIYAVTDARRGIETDTLRAISSATGGRMRPNTDIAAALRDAAAESQLSYTVGFYPAEWDGSTHDVRITTTRSGVRVLAPDSYFADAERMAPPERERAALRAAALSPLDAAEIGLQVAVGHETGERRFDIRVNAHDLWFYRQGEGFEGSVAIAVVALDGENRMASSPVSSFTLHLTPELHEKALTGGLDLSAQRPLDGSAQKVRVIVFDRYSSAAGSVTIPILR